MLNLTVLISNLNATGLDYVIAGGYPRDNYFWKLYTDIDIFYTGDFPYEELKAFFLLEEVASEEYGDNSCTHKGFYEGYRVDFIKRAPIYNSWIECLNSFPLSISQIAIIPQGTFLKTQNFVDTENSKIVLVFPTCTGKYLSKITAKYPEMQYIPECDTSFFNFDNYTNIVSSAFPTKKLKVQIDKSKLPTKYLVINHVSQEPLYREGYA